MADNSPPNPGQSFNEILTQWERDFNTMANQFMSSEGFSQAMNEAQKAQLEMQKLMTTSMNRQMEAMNIPTRNDVLRVAELVKGLEKRLERIEDKLGINDAAMSSNVRPRPRRTKQPPASYTE